MSIYAHTTHNAIEKVFQQDHPSPQEKQRVANNFGSYLGGNNLREKRRSDKRRFYLHPILRSPQGLFQGSIKFEFSSHIE